MQSVMQLQIYTFFYHANVINLLCALWNPDG